MAGKSPTSRTLEQLRKADRYYQVVEWFNHFANRRVDLFGFADVLTICPDTAKLVAIQVTGGGNGSARRKKIIHERTKEALLWLNAGALIEIHDWRKIKVKRGGKAMRWDCRITEVTTEDFSEVFS